MRKHRVWIQAVTRTPDGGGGFTEAWADNTAIWAEIECTAMRERAWASQSNIRGDWKLTVRHSSATNTLKAGDRIRYQTHILRITSIRNPKEANRELDVLCEELQA